MPVPEQVVEADSPILRSDLPATGRVLYAGAIPPPLEQLRAFDIDVLQPSRTFVSNCGDPIRAQAFAALEGRVAPDTDRFPLAHPGGDVRLVPVDRFYSEASDEHRNLRHADPVHSGRRVVLCDPVGALFARWRSRPVPSRFLSHLDGQGFVVNFSKAATALMAARAAQTVSIFRAWRDGGRNVN